MTRPRRLLLLVAGALLLGLMLFFAISRATPYEETIEHGPAPEVRSNPYLAAERFLTDQGRAVDHAQGLGGLTETKDSRQVLLLLGERSTMTPAQAERLLHWVDKGGHLVFVAERIWDENAGNSGDLLLDATPTITFTTPVAVRMHGPTAPARRTCCNCGTGAA